MFPQTAYPVRWESSFELHHIAAIAPRKTCEQSSTLPGIALGFEWQDKVYEMLHFIRETVGRWVWPCCQERLENTRYLRWQIWLHQSLQKAMVFEGSKSEIKNAPKTLIGTFIASRVPRVKSTSARRFFDPIFTVKWTFAILAIFTIHTLSTENSKTTWRLLFRVTLARIWLTYVVL